MPTWNVPKSMTALFIDFLCSWVTAFKDEPSLTITTSIPRSKSLNDILGSDDVSIIVLVSADTADAGIADKVNTITKVKINDKIFDLIFMTTSTE